MSTKFNSFRPDRYLRTRFVEGRYLLASEATDLELELIDFTRQLVRKTIGDVAIGDGWKVEKLSDTELLIKPGELWFQGLPYVMSSGQDHLVSGDNLSLGVLKGVGGGSANVGKSDASDGSGKIITFNSGGTTPSGNYRIVLSFKEEVITAAEDEFLKNFNVPENTAQKLRKNIQVNIVPEDDQDNQPIPYTSSSDGNLVNEIEVIPQAGGNGSVVSTSLVSGSEEIDGRDLEIIVRNDSSASNPSYAGTPVGNQIPVGTAEQQEYTNGTFIDSRGNEYHLNLITNDTVSNQVVIRIDKEPGQDDPTIVDGEPYKIIKRSFYVTDDANGTPQGNLYFPLATLDWDSSDGIKHQSRITDRRESRVSTTEFQKDTTNRLNLFLAGGGTISAEPADKATGSFTIIDYTQLGGATFEINGVDFVEGVDFTAETSNSVSVQNLADAINASSDASIDNIVKATADSSTLDLEAETGGTAGNSITTSFTGSGATANQATLSGGTAAIDGQLSWAEEFQLLNGNTTIQTIAASSSILQDEGVLAYELDLDNGGSIEQGKLAVTTTSTGTSISLSGSPDLSSVKLGNTLSIDSTGESSHITAIDNVNKTVTVASSLGASGAANIHLDTFAQGFLPPSNDYFILAARKSSEYYIFQRVKLPAGSTSDSTSGSGITQELLDYIGSPSSTDDSPDYISTAIVSDGDNLTLGIGKLDEKLDELDRILNQLSLSKSASDQVDISAADISLLDGNILSQELNNFILDFDTTTIDFTSGTVSGGVSGNSFTPQSIPVGEYFWYGVSLVGDSVGADNRISALVEVTFASGSDAVQANAPLPDILGTKKLGAVLVQNVAGSIEVVEIRRLGAGTGSGGGAGTILADLYDPISTSLPSGASATIDGISLANGDQVLFSNLSSGNNQIYEASGVGSSISWDVVRAFSNSSITPVESESVRIQRGDAFAQQLAVYDGTNFLVNDVVRFFDGVSADFWELSSIKTVTLNDNTTIVTPIFTVSPTGSENFVVSYSINRNGDKETGQLYITHDGTAGSVSRASTFVGGDTGITFSAGFSGPDFGLFYQSTSTGSDATFKYFVQRWSDSAGGPTGIPNYSTSSSSTVTAAGTTGDVQFRGSGGNLDADSDFNWDVSGKELNLGGYNIGILEGPTSVFDNQSSPTSIITVGASTNRYLIIDYSIVRDGNYRVGSLLVTHDGTNAVLTDTNTSTNPTGVTFSAAISGPSLEIRYTSTNTGFNGTFKYSIRRWI